MGFKRRLPQRAMDIVELLLAIISSSAGWASLVGGSCGRAGGGPKNPAICPARQQA
jgi:hypothetical protein